MASTDRRADLKFLLNVDLATSKVWAIRVHYSLGL